MKIETKYNIGDRVWVVYEGSYYDNTTGKRQNSGEVNVYDTTIAGIIFSENGLVYYLDEGDDEQREDEIIPFDDKKKLLENIEKLMEEIHKRENGNLQSS